MTNENTNAFFKEFIAKMGYFFNVIPYLRPILISLRPFVGQAYPCLNMVVKFVNKTKMVVK